MAKVGKRSRQTPNKVFKMKIEQTLLKQNLFILFYKQRGKILNQRKNMFIIWIERFVWWIKLRWIHINAKQLAKVRQLAWQMPLQSVQTKESDQHFRVIEFECQVKDN